MEIWENRCRFDKKQNIVLLVEMMLVEDEESPDLPVLAPASEVVLPTGSGISVPPTPPKR